MWTASKCAAVAPWEFAPRKVASELAARLKERKVANIESLRPDMVAAGNIGCIEQIARATSLPVVHSVELLDWATGGPKPRALGG